MSDLRLDADALDPIVCNLGRFAGLLTKPSDNQIEFNTDWFASPYDGYLSQAFKGTEPKHAEQRAALLELVAASLGSSDPETLGLPGGAADGAQWYPIRDTGLYLVASEDDGSLHFGIGVRGETSVSLDGDGPLRLAAWGHLPVIKTSSTAGVQRDQTSQVRGAVEVAYDTGRFGTPQLGFRGVKLAGSFSLNGTGTSDLSLLFLDLQLPGGEAPADRSLADLTDTAAGEWAEMVIALLVSQIQNQSVPYLADLLALAGFDEDVPAIQWADLPSRGTQVFRDWFLALLANNGAGLQSWLGHLQALLGGMTVSRTVDTQGSGTRSDPYRAEIDIPIGATNITLSVTMASAANADGTQTVYPGLWIAAPVITLSGDIKLAFEAALELAAIHLSTPPTADALPACEVRMRLFHDGGLLLDEYNLAATDYADLGTISLGEIRAGLTLDGELRPTPMLVLIDLACGRGSWPVLDLSSADTALDALSDVGTSIIQDQLANLLGAGGPESMPEVAEGVSPAARDVATLHAGHHIAALLGIIPPTTYEETDPWPVDLVVDEGHIATFLGNPLGEIGCYHARCLESSDADGPRWRFLMEDLMALLQHSSVAAPAVTGNGSADDPWSVGLYGDADGMVDLQSWAVIAADTGRPQLTLALDVAPPAFALGGDVELTLHLRVEAVRLDLPPSSACPDSASVAWFPSVGAESAAVHTSGNFASELGGLTLRVGRVALVADWQRAAGLHWSLVLNNPSAEWTPSGGETISRVWDQLVFDEETVQQILPATESGLEMETREPLPPLNDLLLFALGSGLMERGGPFGFGLAGLLGLVPNMPGFAFPTLTDGSASPFTLPADWPVFLPADWSTFFDNPWPDVRLHLAGLLSNPLLADGDIPRALRWLGGMLHLSLPDLALPDLGWPTLAASRDVTGLPFTIGGAGTIEEPWAIPLHGEGGPQLQVLIWLDPAGPASSPTHFGLGLGWLSTAADADSGVQVETLLRLDLRRLAIDAAVDTSSYVQLPRLTLLNTLRGDDGWLVGESLDGAPPSADPWLEWAELGCILSAGGVEPILRLHNGRVEGTEVPPFELPPPPDATAPDPTAVPPQVSRLLDEMMRALPRDVESPPEGAPALPRDVGDIAAGFPTLCQLLADLGLAVPAGSGYGLDLNAWTSLLGSPQGYLQSQLTTILADPAGREGFLAALRSHLGLDGTAIGPFLFADASEAAVVSGLREVLAQLGFLYPAAQGYAPHPAAWLDLVADPVGALRSRAQALLSDEGRRLALINHLRTRDGQHAVGTGLFSVSITSAGGVSLHIGAGNPLVLAEAIQVYGDIHLDLARRSLSADVRVRPAQINVAVAAVYSLTFGQGSTDPLTDDWKLQLCIGDSACPYPYAPIDIYPVPADLAADLGEILPRYLASTFAARVLETELLASQPFAVELLEHLGLVYRRSAAANWQLRPLDGLILDPAGWLLSEGMLGTVDGQIDFSRASDAIAALGNMMGLAVSVDDVISLPYGLSLGLGPPGAGGSGMCLNLRTASPLTLFGSTTLDLQLGLTLTPDAQVGTNSTMELSFPGLGIPWDPLIVRAGITGEAFSLEIGEDPDLIVVYPFAGWDRMLMGLGDQVAQLLPTMVGAAVEALQDQAAGDSDLGDFLTDLTAAAGTLGVNSATGLGTLVGNPVGWLQDRFADGTIAADSAEAVYDVLSPLMSGLSTSGGLVSYQPVDGGDGSVTIQFGQNADDGNRIGVWLEIQNLSAGPLQIGAGASIGIDDSTPAELQTSVSLDLSLDEDIIEVGEIDLRPGLHFSYVGPGWEISLHPFGVLDFPLSAGHDFHLDLPTFEFCCSEGHNLSDCLPAFASYILVQIVLELFLDSDAVTGWLNTPLIEGRDTTKPGELLTPTLLESPRTGVYNLRPLTRLANAAEVLQGLLGKGLAVLYDVLGDGADPLIALGEGGIYLAHRNDGSDLYGLRVDIPDLRVSEDPEIVLELGGDPAWIGPTSHDAAPSDLPSGISLYLIKNTGSGFEFDLQLDMVSMGIDLSGKNDEPLIDLGSFRLEGLYLRIYLSLANLDATAQVDFGAQILVNEIGIPLGAGGDNNAVAKGLLGGKNGKGTGNGAVNPSFSVALSCFKGATASSLVWDVNLGGADANEAWFPIQAAFGPIHVDQIGVRWDSGAEELSILLDGGVSIEGLAVGVDDLALTIPIETALDLSTWRLGLRGLAIAYSGSGVRIAGGLVQAGTGDQIRYDGLCLIEVGGQTFAALGSFAKLEEYTSLFVFVVLPLTLGGPPYFFVIGLAGGFGYNRGLVVPDVTEVEEFSLVGIAEDETLLDRPEQALARLGDDFPVRRGSYWLAVGVRFKSFELVKSMAVAYLLLDQGLEVGLLGVSRMLLPEAKPLIYIELLLKVRLSTAEGVLSVEARLTDDSWLLSESCKLTGGFAFYVWFGGEHKGDCVITLGGYHPRFIKPAHYPDVPRLGFNWRFSSKVTIKGEVYFALTPSCVMTGGLLEASYQSGNLKAWFKAWADFLIAWRPFAYDIEIGVSIGVSYRLSVNLGPFGRITKTLKIELGARVWLWGPKMSGEAEVTFLFISCTVRFGGREARGEEKPPIDWPEFRSTFLPAENADLFGGRVAKGLLEEVIEGEDPDNRTVRWLLQPEFVLRTETVLPANYIKIGSSWATTNSNGEIILESLRPPAEHDLDIRPMDESDIESQHIVRIKDDSNHNVDTTQLRFQVLSGSVPAALWDNEDRDEGPEAKTVPAWSGLLVVADIQEHDLAHTGEIPVKEIFEWGVLPLPFELEINTREHMAERAESANFSDSLLLYEATDQGLRASKAILGKVWQDQRVETIGTLGGLGLSVPAGTNLGLSAAYLERDRYAPPQIASLYEGLAPEPVTEAEITMFVTETPRELGGQRLIPRLKAICRQAAAPIRPAARAIRTTVDKVAGAEDLPRVPIRRVVAESALPAMLRRVDPPWAPRHTALANTGSVFINDRLATALQRSEFDRLQEQAVVGETFFSKALLQAVEEPEEEVPEEQVPEGVSLPAGLTYVWELPSRDTIGEMPVLHFRGDQAIRVTCLSRGSKILADVEAVGNGEYQLPAQTARCAVSGLGRPSQAESVKPETAAVTLEEAAYPNPMVGWQGTMELTQVTRSVLLGRGAVVRMGTPLRTRRRGRRVDQAFVKAAEAVRGQFGHETFLPNRITTLGILVARPNGTEQESLAQALSLSVQGAALSARPITVVGAAHILLLYDVLGVDQDRSAITVRLASKPGWRVDGVLGMRGRAAHWADVLANEPLTRLVESGPLTPQGQTQIGFSLDVTSEGE